MSYLRGPESARHRRFHDERLKGVPWKPYKAEKVVRDVDELRIVLVDFSCPQFLRKRAAKVGTHANRETQYKVGVYFPHWSGNEALIGVIDNRAVSILVVKPMHAVWHLTWAQYDKGTEPVKVPEAAEQRGCAFLWVLQKHRGDGIARAMANTAVARSGLEKEHFPWLRPFTPTGERFLRRYCPQRFAMGAV